MLLRRPIRDLVNETHEIPRIGRRLFHKVILHLFHTEGGRLNDQVIQIFEIAVKVARCAVAGIRQCLDPRAGKPVFGVARKALCHNFFLLEIMLLLGYFH